MLTPLQIVLVTGGLFRNAFLMAQLRQYLDRRGIRILDNPNIPISFR